MKFRIWPYLCLVLAGLANAPWALAQEFPHKIIKAHMVLDGQSRDGGKSFINLREASAHTIREAAMDQGEIDLIYAYGKTTGANLLTPASPGNKLFTAYKGTVFENWTLKNKGTLIALGKDKEVRKSFKKLKTGADLQAAYDRAARTVMLREDYRKSVHGPGARIQKLEIGDHFVFRSKGRKLYAMGRVVNREGSYSGELSIDWKTVRYE